MGLLKAVSVLLLISSVVYNANAAGEFTVLHHPSGVSFKGHDRISESLLKEVYSAALGFSIEADSNWQGMYLTDPFSLAEALVVVEVDGVSSIAQVKGHHFPLNTDDEDNTYASLKRRILQRYGGEASNLVHADFGEGLEELYRYPIFHGVKSDKAKKPIFGHLKTTIDEDREFLQEVTLLNSIADKIEEQGIKRDYVPDVFWFKIASLHALVDLHGDNSTAAKEARQLLNDAILRLNAAFKKAYEGSALVSVIVSDASHTRRTRSILATASKEDVNFDSLNLAKAYSKDYPVVFNIMLWFGVAMVFSLLAISLVIGDMDPGRDSIIYRMTNTRMKKDN